MPDQAKRLHVGETTPCRAPPHLPFRERAAEVGSEKKMVGGGWVAISDPDIKVHFAVNLLCPAAEVGFNPQPDPPGREALLQVRAGSDRFTLTALEAASCSNNLYEGQGMGTCNGTGNGIIIDFRFVDGGRGGRAADSAMIRIHRGGCSRLSLEGPLGGGNVTIGDEEN